MVNISKRLQRNFDIDEAFLPIGAYLPEEIMKHVHTSPPEALQAAHDLKVKNDDPNPLWHLYPLR